MRTRSWYRGAVAAVAAAGLLLTAACSDDPDGNGDGDPGASSDVIDWWDIQPTDGDLGTVFAAFVAQFNEQNEGGTQVSITSIENGDPFNNALANAMQSNEPPDMFQSWGGAELRNYVEAGLVRDITDDLADVIATISPAAIAPWVVDGRVYGLPFNTGMVGFWYNIELFDQVGIDQPPTTWSGFLDTVDQFQAEGITPISLGIGGNPWPGHFWWSLLAVRTAGLDALAQARETGQLDHPGFVEAGELLGQLVEKEPFPPGYLTMQYENEDGQAATMARGEAAMELMGQWSVGGQIDHSGADDAESERLTATRAFFPFPAVEGAGGDQAGAFGGGDGFAFGANAPDETIDLARLIFENYADIVALPGTVPTVAGMIDQIGNPALLPLAEALEAAPGAQLYLDRDWPGAVGTEVNTQVAALIAGQQTPQGLVDEINGVWAREG